METDYLGAFLMGLFGTLHCVSMCGSITGILTFSLPGRVREDNAGLFTYLGLYNAGRLASYILAGGVAGAFGSTILYAVSPQSGHQVLMALATLLMVAVGFYLAGWFPGLANIERIGTPVWKWLEPIGRKLLPVSSPLQALLYGMIWGWLPCGLVYSALFIALAQGNFYQGGLFMLAFGVGTLPAIFATGLFADRILLLAKNPKIRQFAGILLIFLALSGLIINW